MKLAAVGSNCVDYYPDLENGKAFPGGGPVNMAVYTIRLGGKASYIGPVGADANGEFLKNAMNQKGVDLSHLHIQNGKTAVTQVLLDGSERHFGEYDEGVLSDYTLSEEDIRFIRTHDVVVCDLWGKVWKQFPALKQTGIKTAFDAATALDSAISQNVLPYTDYFFFSSDQGDTPSLREKMIACAKKGPTLIIAMLGENGSLCFDRTDFHKYGIIPCDHLTDTLGAGDSYISGFLFGIVNGYSIEKSMETGARNASETLTYFGAW